MRQMHRNLKNQLGKISQKLLIVMALIVTALLALGLLISDKSNSAKQDAHGQTEEDEHAEDEGKNTAHAETEHGNVVTEILIRVGSFIFIVVATVRASNDVVTVEVDYTVVVRHSEDEDAPQKVLGLLVLSSERCNIQIEDGLRCNASTVNVLRIGLVNPDPSRLRFAHQERKAEIRREVEWILRRPVVVQFFKLLRPESRSPQPGGKVGLRSR